MSITSASDIVLLLKTLGLSDANGSPRGPVGAAGNSFANAILQPDAQFSIAGVANAADATDDTLFTKAIGANLLDVNAKGLLVIASGSFGATGNNKTIKLILGTTTLFTTGVITTNAKKWVLIAGIMRSAAGTQLAYGGLFADATNPVVAVATGAEDLTTGLNLKLTGASPTSSAASDVVANTFQILALNYKA